MEQLDSIAILGVYPPPPGGVAKHVERLCAQLRNRGINYTVFNAVSSAEDRSLSVRSVYRKRKRWFLWYVLTGRERVVYVLSDRLFAWVGSAFMSRIRRKRVVIRLRNSALEDWQRSSRLRYFIAIGALRRVDGVVVVSRRLEQEAQGGGAAPKQSIECVVAANLRPVVGRCFEQRRHIHQRLAPRRVLR